MSGQQVFGRPYKDKVPSVALVLAAQGGDPGAGVAVPVPQWAHSFSVFTVGTGNVLLRQQDSNDLATDAPSTTTCHTYPGATLLGPFPLERTASNDTMHIVLAEDAAAAITAYRINWYK